MDRELKDLLDAMVGLTLSHITASDIISPGSARETVLMLDVQADAAFKANRAAVGMHFRDWADTIRQTLDLPPRVE